MSTDKMNRSLAKAADAAGYAMASAEEDFNELMLQPEVALRNGHLAAARSAGRMSLPFARFEHWIAQMLALSDFSRAHTPRGLLPSR